MPWSCVGGARGWPGGSGPVPVLASLLGLLPAPASLAVGVAGCPARMSLPFACLYAIPCGLCVPRPRSGCPSGPRHVSVACVCARAPAAYAPPPPSGSVWCAHYARFRYREPVGPFQAVRAPPCSWRGPVPRLFSSLGGGPVPSSPCLAWGHAPPCGQACFCVLALRAVGTA